MKRLVFFALATLLATTANAQDAAVAARPLLLDAGVRAVPDAAAALPTGHPSIGRNPQQQDPPLFRPPPDSTDDDSTLPAGSIRIELRDARNMPVANHPLELGIIQQSVAKGESRKHLSANTDAAGAAVFGALETGSGVAYRVSAHEGAASFAARPFQLSQQKGMRVVLHVYPATGDYARGAIILSRGIVLIELKDDRVQIQQRVDIRNGSPVAWVPTNFILKLPEDFTALNNVQQMSDVGVDAMPKEGAKLHGTFGPGETSVFFNWQLPYSNQAEVQFDIGLPPNLGALVIRAAAAPGMRLEVDGFPSATGQTNEEGQRELVTGRQIEQGDAPMRSVHIALRDLPTPGPARLVGTALAALGVAAGVYLGINRTRQRKPGSERRDRTRILLEIEQLEHARAAGDVGPKTYERARRELIDDLAQLIARKSENRHQE